MELPGVKMEKLWVEQISGGRNQGSVEGMLSLRCLLNFHVKMLRMKLNLKAWNSVRIQEM